MVAYHSIQEDENFFVFAVKWVEGETEARF